MPCINPRTFFVFENGLTTLNPEAPGIVGSFPKGCGNCYDCAVRKAAEWSARLVCESQSIQKQLVFNTHIRRRTRRKLQPTTTRHGRV